MCDKHYQRWHYRWRKDPNFRPAHSRTVHDAIAALTVQLPGEDGCQVWRSDDRYPWLSYRGRRYRAHRLSWVLHNGADIPAGMCVLHTCDNSLCVRGDHLVLGTKKDNAEHIACRGRYGRNVKLSRAKADYIRQHRRGARICDLAVQFGVSRYAIRNVLQGKSWTTECS